MSITNEATTPAPQHNLAELQQLVAAMAGPEDRHDEAERFPECFEQAAALRESVAGTVEGAQAALAEVEAETTRLVNAARAALRDVQAVAQSAEQKAAAAESTGRAYRQAANLAQQAQEAHARAEELAAERLDILGTADALNARLSDLNGLQAAAQADLVAARAATDADAAGEARTRLTGIQEVTPVLVSQRDTALARARVIGTEDSGGMYAQLLGRVASLIVERGHALDAAEPGRIEARRAANPLGALLDDVAKLTPAAREKVLSGWTASVQPQPGNTPIQRSADGHITGNVGGVHHTN